jgi:hypothetical protein
MTSPRPRKNITVVRIRRDLIKGKKPAEIALNRNVSVGYVYAIRAKLKKEGLAFIDKHLTKDATFIADIAPSAGIMGLVEPITPPEEPVLVATLVETTAPRRINPEIAGVVGVVVTLVLLATFLWITTR